MTTSGIRVSLFQHFYPPYLGRTNPSREEGRNSDSPEAVRARFSPFDTRAGEWSREGPAEFCDAFISRVVIVERKAIGTARR